MPHARTLPLLSLLAILGLLTTLAACQAPAPEPPPAPDHTELWQAYVDVWNTGDVDALDSLVTADFVRETVSTPAGSNMQDGLDSLKAEILRVREANEGFTVEIHETVSTADHLTSRWTIRGTSAQMGTSFEVDGMSLSRIADGRFTHEHSAWDNLSLVQQLGFTVMPPAPPEGME